MPSEPIAFNATTFLTYLVQEGLLTDAVAKRVATAADETSTSVERAVLELGLLAEDIVYRAVASFLGVPFAEANEYDQSLVQSGPLRIDFMQRALAIPIARDDEGFLIATANPDFTDLLANIAFMLGTPARAAIATPNTIKGALVVSRNSEIPEAADATHSDVARLTALANDGPIITLVNDIIGKAVGLGASDVHFEGQERSMRLRYRLDGALVTDRLIPDGTRESVTSRLKIMANLNISEKRRPQDGRTSLVVRGRTIDIRMSTLPTQHGESVVLRLLDQYRVKLDWAFLNFPSERVSQIESLMASPNGIFLVAGPTGSGKTTTLYTALSGINSDDRKIITVEDPIEYALEGVNQVQVDPAIDMTFARALRAILRQDPNVLMVGEIRDEETAEISARAALIGRLVLSTIHTNDAISAVDRLLDLGIAPYLVGATLRGVLSQRLVRKICEACAGDGCDACAESGSKGRIAVSEILTISPEIAEAIVSGQRGVGLAKTAKNQGFIGISDHAELLLAQGVISKADALAVLGFRA